MDAEDNYVVRITWHARPVAAGSGHDIRTPVSGVVESPVSGRRQAFRSIEELWAVLAKLDFQP